MPTAIPYVNENWDIVTGCNKIAQGCKDCWARRIWPRLASHPGTIYYGRSFEDVRAHPERATLPGHWKKPRRVFVDPKGDLFHDAISFQTIQAIFHRMAQYERHTFLVFTKRHRRMREFFEWWQADNENARANNCVYIVPPLPNVWLIYSASTQAEADEGIEDLLSAPGVVRGLSLEPQIEAIDLRFFYENRLTGKPYPLDPARRERLHWVITGGESGRKAHAYNPTWARWIVEQCREAGVAVYVKQMGSNRMGLHLCDAHGADPAEWPEDLRIREFPR